MEKYAAVVSLHGEVVSLPQALQTLVLPMPIFRNEAVLLHRPPAAFCASLTEKEADALHLPRHLHTQKALS
jgi:hypothetical protein